MFGRDGVVRSDGFTEYRPERPTSKEGVQALFNEQVVSVKWSKGKDSDAKKAGFDHISFRHQFGMASAMSIRTSATEITPSGSDI